MMTFAISAPIKLLSLNKAFKTLRNGRRARSQEYREFAKSIEAIMSLRKKEFNAFNEAYKPTEHEIHAHLVINTPDLYTKKGTINKKSGDIDNYCKPLFDNIFTGCVDDSQLVKLTIDKKFSIKIGFMLELKIKEKNDI